MHLRDQAPRLPPLIKSPKYILIFRESGPVDFWSTPPKSPDPPWTQPPTGPLRIDSFIYQLIAFNVRIPDMYFIFQLTRDAKNNGTGSWLF